MCGVAEGVLLIRYRRAVSVSLRNGLSTEIARVSSFSRKVLPSCRGYAGMEGHPIELAGIKRGVGTRLSYTTLGFESLAPHTLFRGAN